MAAAQAGGRTTSIAEAMLSRGREGTAGYVRRRMAEMQRALAEELAAVDRQHARRRGKLPQQVSRIAHTSILATRRCSRRPATTGATDASQTPSATVGNKRAFKHTNAGTSSR